MQSANNLCISSHACVVIVVLASKCEVKTNMLAMRVMLGFTSRYWVHWDTKPKRSGRDIRFYVPVKKDGT